MKKNRFVKSTTLLGFTIFLFGLISGIKAQDLTMTFSASGDSLAIDSIMATNMTTSEAISLPGWEPLTLSHSSGIENFEFDPNIRIYPNPFDGEATIETQQSYAQTVHLSVRNIVGQEVTQSSSPVTAGRSLFRLSLSSPGIFFILISGSDRTQCLKIVCTNSQKQSNTLQLQTSAALKKEDQKERATSATNYGDNQYNLAFEPGDLIHYQCYSGKNKTVVADYPEISKNYSVEFHVCIDRDGMSYPITRIGTQVWTTRNLAYLPKVSSFGYELSANPAYYVYGYEGLSVSFVKNTLNYQTYGALYNWAAAKTACPDGWRLPSIDEWAQLFDYLSPYAGYKIRERSRGHWDKSNSNSTDEVGFTALPGGELYPFISTNSNLNIDPGFLNIGTKANFWTNSQKELTYKDGVSPVYVTLDNSSQGYDTNFEHDYYITHYWVPSVSTITSGYSVRCVLGKKPTKPTPELIEASEIAESSFLISGRIADDGESKISEMGFCWAEHASVSLDDQSNSQDFQEGVFRYRIEGLNANTTYYVNAYAINEEGIGYGEEITVTTKSGMAAVETSFIVKITDTSALAGGTIVTSGGNPIIENGFCWASHQYPTHDDHFISCGISETTFKSSISNLSPHSTYYLRAYAVTTVGTSYGSALKLKTAEGSFTYHGDRYGYLTIGNQVWMNQNLRYLPVVNTLKEESSEEPKFYVYDYTNRDTAEAKLTENYLKYGVLYNWHAAMKSEPASDLAPSRVQGICPPGWHLPSRAEYDILMNTAGTITSAYKSDFDWDESIGMGSNNYGFNALPAGHKSYQFEQKNMFTGFWTTTYGDENHPLIFSVGDRININQFGSYRSNAYSVRCLKNNGGSPPRAFLSSNRVIGSIDTEFLFDASESYDYDTPNEELLCRWDWNNDGVWDTDYEKQLLKSHSFHERGVYEIVMEIIDSEELTGQAALTITIADGHFTDSRDDIEYVFVNIGNQSWMAENLRYLPAVHNYHDGSETAPFYYVLAYWGDNPDEAKESMFYDRYGVWYNYPAAETACPNGWHLPSDEEWKELERALGMTTDESNNIYWRESGSVGSKLKATYSWLLDGNGTNSSLFTALGGQLDAVYNPDYYEPGFSCDFWTSTNNTSGEVFQRRIIYSSVGVFRYATTKRAATSIRCVKDK